MLELMRLLEPRRLAVERELEQIAAAVEGRGTAAAAVRYALAAPGKRLRPVLCLAAAEAAAKAAVGPAAKLEAVAAEEKGTDSPALIRAAAAIEIVHTYSLVHDDLPCMDNDDLRRGRPTAHRAFGTVPAALAGFALIPMACAVLRDATRELDLPAPAQAAALRELCQAAGAAGMVGGQVRDLEAEGAALDLPALTAIHAMKTGALFRGALRLGGILASAPVSVVDALGAFGSGLGLAFQIADDILDETMDAAALGKTPGKDRDTGKSTFVSLLGVDGAREAAAQEAGAAIAALRTAGLHSPLLEGLARFAVDRDR